MATKIEWVRCRDGTKGETWNPIAGCSPKSEGCQNCYAARLAATRLRGHPLYKGLTSKAKRWNGGWRVAGEDVIAKPLRWRKPRTVFVCSMSDLFYEAISALWIVRVFGVMAACPHHTFQVLTKRTERMERMLRSPGFEEDVRAAAVLRDPNLAGRDAWQWPLPNVWLGTTVESGRMRSRIEVLARIPAAVRFLSCEPLLSQLDLWGWLDGIHQVIVGCESGPDARPMELDWARDARDDCESAGCAFFLKAAMIDDQLVKLPELDGRTWEEMPKR